MDTISVSGNIVSEFKKVEINKLVHSEKGGVVNGGDIIGATRYYKDNSISIELDGTIIDKIDFLDDLSSNINSLGYDSELEFYEAKFDVLVDEEGNISYKKIIK